MEYSIACDSQLFLRGPNAGRGAGMGSLTPHSWTHGKTGILLENTTSGTKVTVKKLSFHTRQCSLWQASRVAKTVKGQMSPTAAVPGMAIHPNFPSFLNYYACL